ncbi:hypothetical protein D3Z39_09425 [Anaerotruncus colihominis]|uniref:Uncharacterized protein n=1 Tax=Anaerotruncus colihominis TaxID=169435 RepID=A0A845RJI6_9FIRM|nr:hypothetical protein [Anaerotruncus colihominis]
MHGTRRASPDEQYARIQAALLQKIQTNKSLHHCYFLDFTAFIKKAGEQAARQALTPPAGL